MDFAEALGKQFIIQAATHTKLKVLVDKSGAAIAQRLYKTYCSDEDFSQFHTFLQELDTLLTKFSKNKDSKDDEDDKKGLSEEDEEEDKAGMATKDAKDDTETKKKVEAFFATSAIV
jgi:hypothetical protein